MGNFKLTVNCNVSVCILGLLFFLISSNLSANNVNSAVNDLFNGNYAEGMKKLEVYSSEGDMVSMELLAYFYSGTPFYKVDLEKSRYLYDLADKSGGLEARVKILELDLINSGKYPINDYLKIKGSNHPAVFLRLGEYYLSGPNKNILLSRKYFSKVNEGWFNIYRAENFLSIINYFFNKDSISSRINYLVKRANKGYEAAQYLLADSLIRSKDKDYALIKSWIDIADSVGYRSLDVDRSYIEKNITRADKVQSSQLSKKWHESKSSKNSPYSEAANWCNNYQPESLFCLSKAINHHVECSIDIHYQLFEGWYSSEGYRICRKIMISNSQSYTDKE